MAVLNARRLLSELVSPRKRPRLPAELRRQANALLRHYPELYHLRQLHKEMPMYWGSPDRRVRPRVIALDLEGTLISNAISQIPRPGLKAFLERCNELFERVVVFTTVDEKRFRDIAGALAADGLVPGWFATAEHITWVGETKDLAYIPGARVEDVLLVDDQEIYVHPGQDRQWIRVDVFEPPYSQTDSGLAEVLATLERRVAADADPNP